VSGICEVVARGKLSTSVTGAIGFDSARSVDGVTFLIGHDVDQARLHGLFQLLQDLNIELVSVNELSET